MRSIETVNFATARGPAMPTSEALPPGAPGQVQVQRRTDQATLTWTLPLNTGFDGHAQAVVMLTVADGMEVPVTLRLLDGPMLELVYGAAPPLANFDNFRCFVSAPDLPRRELGGGSSTEGVFFRSAVLGNTWATPRGPVTFELGL